jgi:hypothetical protein
MGIIGDVPPAAQWRGAAPDEPPAQARLGMEVIMQPVLAARLTLFTLCLGISTGPAFADEDDGSKMTITSPKNGAEVGDTFELKYELVKGSKAAHGHVYLDGEPQKTFPGPS